MFFAKTILSQSHLLILKNPILFSPSNAFTFLSRRLSNEFQKRESCANSIGVVKTEDGAKQVIQMQRPLAPSMVLIVLLLSSSDERASNGGGSVYSFIKADDDGDPKLDTINDRKWTHSQRSSTENL